MASQPNNLGDIWDLLRKCPTYRPNELVYLAVYSHKKQDLGYGLYQVLSVGVVDLTLKPLGTLEGLVETPDQVVSVPMWAPLQKTGIN